MITAAKIIREDCPPEVYRASAGERGKPDFIMSRGSIMDFASCPMRWRTLA